MLLIIALIFCGLVLSVASTKSPKAVEPKKVRLGVVTSPSDEEVASYRTRIVQFTNNPKQSGVNPEDLAELAREIAANEFMQNSLFNGENYVLMLGAASEASSLDMLELVEDAVLNPHKNHLLNRDPRRTLRVRVNGDQEQSVIVRGNHVIFKVKPSSSQENVLTVITFGCPTVEIEVERTEDGKEYPAPVVRVISLGCGPDVITEEEEKDVYPHVITEGVDVYFFGAENAHLSVVDGEACMFGGCVSGLHSQVTLYGETVSVGGYGCRIHACDQSRVEVGSKCKTTYYDAAGELPTEMRLLA